MTNSRSMTYRPEIDGLRAVAIVSVVLFHAGGTLFGGGYVGVDIFFVISGYLITAMIAAEAHAGRFSYADFYARRARRILPALLAMIAIVTAACFLLFLPADLIDYGKLLIDTLLFGANFRLMGEPSYFDTSSRDNPLLHMWSLSVEEQFYLLWPTLLVALLSWLSLRRSGRVVFLLALASLACSEILAQSWPKGAFYHLPSRGFELLAGALLAIGFVPAIRSRAVGEAASLVGIGLMIAPVFLYGKETAFPGVAALPPVLGCSLVIHSESAFKTRVGAFLRFRPVVFIGLISYSLYLWHWPVFALPSYVLMREATPAETTLCIAAAVALSILSWSFIERPFRRTWRLPKARAARPIRGWTVLLPFPYSGAAAAGLATAVSLIVCGIYFEDSKGASWRLPSSVQALLAVSAPTPSQAKPTKTDRHELLTTLREGRVGMPRGSGDPIVVLWGDSHAAHYAPLVEAVYGSFTTYQHSDCPPVGNTYFVKRAIDALAETCFKSKEIALAKILAEKPDVVILAGRWTYVEPFPYGHEMRTTRFFVRGRDDPRDLDHSKAVFAAELANTVATLTTNGIEVVLMGQVPEQRQPVIRCLARALLFHREPASCVTQRAEVEKRLSFVNGVLATIEKANPSTTVFWPIPAMCDDARCYAARDGKALYSDNHHLTADGALLLADAFKSSIPPRFLLPRPLSSAALAHAAH